MDNLSLSALTLRPFKTNFDKERHSHFRLSNDVISSLMQMSPTSWRVFEVITQQLDVYPSELISNEDFLKDLSDGRVSIPEHYRTVRVNAADYIKKFGLTPSNGYRTFTLDALTLFDETLANINFDQKHRSADIRLSRPVSDITFHTQLIGKTTDDGETVRNITEKLIKRDSSDKREEAVWQCSSATFVLHEKLALHMLFLQRMFTRIETKTTRGLSKAGSKLYTLLKMIATSQHAINDGWVLQMDLQQCNALSGTDYKGIADYSRNFKLSDELTKMTEFHVLHDKDKRSKQGQKFTRLNVFFSLKAATEIAQIPLSEVKRKLVPRPRVLVGSDAEGKWAQKNIAILLDFEKRLNAVGRILPKPDRERLARYTRIIGDRT